MMRQTISQWRTIGMMAGMVLADFRRESRISLCAVLGLAAVAAPLLVLFGLKFGIVETLKSNLTRDPRSTELRPIGQGLYGPDWFAALGRRPEVAFLIPTTRFLAATVSLRNPGAGDAIPVSAEIVPTAKGDPLLGPLVPAESGTDVILSAPAAEKLRVRVGDRIEGRVGRLLPNGDRETVRFEMAVTAILAVAAMDRDAVFVPFPLMLASEDFREGFAVPEMGWSGQPRPPGDRTFASFRIFTRSIDDVLDLRDHLAGLGVDSDARLAEIGLVRNLEQALTTLLLLVAGLGGVGYVFSQAIAAWASVERKRRSFSIMRLLGFSSLAVAAFPLMQSGLIGILGGAVAVSAFLVMEPLINTVFAGRLHFGQTICFLPFPYIATTMLIMIAVSIVASLAAGSRASTIAAAEGLRDD